VVVQETIKNEGGMLKQTMHCNAMPLNRKQQKVTWIAPVKACQYSATGFQPTNHNISEIPNIIHMAR